MKDLLFESYTDIVADYGGHEILFYHDSGNANVTTDRFYHFATWEEMLLQPIFWGRTLPEIVSELTIDW
ncbi:MAG: hypothetical protein ACI4ML_13385 [Aristaeellaceae bacterium]